MKKLALTVLAVALPAVLALARDKKNVADYPLTAHVVSSSAGEGSSGTVNTSTYNPQTGKWTYGNGVVSEGSHASVAFRVGNLVYTGGYGCRKHVEVGTDVHARIEKHKIYILADDGETCWTHIYSTREIDSK